MTATITVNRSKLDEFMGCGRSAEAQAKMDEFNAQVAAKQAAARAERETAEAAREAMIARRRAARLEREAEEAAEIAKAAPVAQPVNRGERPATDAQRSYLRRLGVSITDLSEPNLTVARASELIDAAKNESLESFGGHWAGSFDARD